MATLDRPNVRIQVLIDAPTAFGRFQDALYFTSVEYALLTNLQVQAMADARAAAWVVIAQEASVRPHVPLTTEQKAERRAELEAEIAVLDSEGG